MESPGREKSKSWYRPSSLRNLLGSASASRLSDAVERAGNDVAITLPILFSSKSAKNVRGSNSASRLDSGQATRLPGIVGATRSNPQAKEMLDPEEEAARAAAAIKMQAIRRGGVARRKVSAQLQRDAAEQGRCQLCLSENPEDQGVMVSPCDCQGYRECMHIACLQQRHANAGFQDPTCPFCRRGYKGEVAVLLATSNVAHWGELARKQRGGRAATILAHSELVLAGLLTEIGQLDEALRLSQQSLERHVKIAGARSAASVTCLGQISDVLLAQNKIADALKVKQQALAIHTQLFGKSDEIAAKLNDQTGGLLKLLGRIEEAEECFESAIECYERVHGTDQHQAVASVMLQLAACHLARGKKKNAIMVYETAVHIRRACLGHHHAAVAEALHLLGIALAAAGNKQQTRAACQEAMQIAEKGFDRTRPDDPLPKYTATFRLVLSNKSEKTADGKRKGTGVWKKLALQSAQSEALAQPGGRQSSPSPALADVLAGAMDGALLGKSALVGRVLRHKREQEAKGEADTDGGWKQVDAAPAAMWQTVEVVQLSAAHEAKKQEQAAAQEEAESTSRQMAEAAAAEEDAKLRQSHTSTSDHMHEQLHSGLAAKELQRQGRLLSGRPRSRAEAVSERKRLQREAAEMLKKQREANSSRGMGSGTQPSSSGVVQGVDVPVGASSSEPRSSSHRASSDMGPGSEILPGSPMRSEARLIPWSHPTD